MSNIVHSRFQTMHPAQLQPTLSPSGVQQPPLLQPASSPVVNQIAHGQNLVAASISQVPPSIQFQQQSDQQHLQSHQHQGIHPSVFTHQQQSSTQNPITSFSSISPSSGLLNSISSLSTSSSTSSCVDLLAGGVLLANTVQSSASPPVATVFCPSSVYPIGSGFEGGGLGMGNRGRSSLLTGPDIISLLDDEPSVHSHLTTSAGPSSFVTTSPAVGTSDLSTTLFMPSGQLMLPSSTTHSTGAALLSSGDGVVLPTGQLLVREPLRHMTSSQSSLRLSPAGLVSYSISSTPPPPQLQQQQPISVPIPLPGSPPATGSHQFQGLQASDSSTSQTRYVFLAGNEPPNLRASLPTEAFFHTASSPPQLHQASSLVHSHLQQTHQTQAHQYNHPQMPLGHQQQQLISQQQDHQSQQQHLQRRSVAFHQSLGQQSQFSPVIYHTDFQTGQSQLHSIRLQPQQQHQVIHQLNQHPLSHQLVASASVGASGGVTGGSGIINSASVADVAPVTNHFLSP
ncbi:unnamed protein product [Protopolystoma xenopodis]|uniref:Uncharacterized protein n=1 Tax=Protopolystoma xenopodis TaxID=117903 RepID=A0A448WAN8_9PLAT|nr:unnamed protein product [Protopolystoma xenopodis]